jgi:mutator protein MutT
MIEYKQCAVVMVFNDSDQLVLQLRSATDGSFPGYWDFSAGGGIDTGEEPQQSAKRELAEELGITAEVEFVSKEHFSYPAWTPNTTREVDSFIYKTRHNGPFQVDGTEVEKIEFFSLTEIERMIEVGGKFHPEFILSWNKGIFKK